MMVAAHVPDVKKITFPRFFAILENIDTHRLLTKESKTEDEIHQLLNMERQFVKTETVW